MTTTPAEKMRVREALRAKRAELAAAAPGDHGDRLRDHFLSTAFADQGPHTIAGYWPLPGEADPRPLMIALHAAGHNLALPVVTGAAQPLIFRAWAPGDTLTIAGFGISEPDAHQPTVQPDILLVPLLGVDKTGNRMGQGGGFYDRTLGQLRGQGDVLAIGIAFDGQQVDSVPHDSFDQRLDALVTETGVRYFS